MKNLRKVRNDPDFRYQNVNLSILNPKSISMGELYGEVDPFTQEWQDGLASSLIRKANTPRPDDSSYDPHQREWIVFDGPVDASNCFCFTPVWIENMNTVLDDTMTLCLPNSERIKLRSELRMLFEVQDLAVASPATVSRCGMVYISPENLGWQPYVKTWFAIRVTTDVKKISEGVHGFKIAIDARSQGILLNLFLNTLDKVFGVL